jgi:hypothetical protein
MQATDSEAMRAALQAMEVQYKGLQSLVGELLLTNQRLRTEIAELRQQPQPTATATHPQPRQDH